MTEEDKFMDSVIYAYYDCLRGKRSSVEAVHYQNIVRHDLPILAKSMWDGTYSPSPSTCFMVHKPKDREVFAANFRDRIVHHWICLRLEPLFEKHIFVPMGNVSFNCRKGFGTTAAVNYIEKNLVRLTNNYQKEVTYFKGDLSGFFMSILKPLLNAKLKTFIEKYYHGDYKSILLNLTQVTVLHHPERNCIINSDAKEWLKLPKNKSLFYSEDRGMPIGNLTTQLFANFFMSEFDAFVRKYFKEQDYAYARFVDDFIILCRNKKFLKESIPVLENFLWEELSLTLHKNKRSMQKATRGVLFCGTYLKVKRKYLSNRTVSNFYSRIHGFNEDIKNKEPNMFELEHMVATMNSYLGFCKGLKTFKLRKKIFEQFDKEKFDKYFLIDENLSKVQLKDEYKPIANRDYQKIGLIKNKNKKNKKRRWRKSNTVNTLRSSPQPNS
jgi:hypothetical protein